uniref:Uncharacterized protein n=1 Tax=Peronospora matthiolae TaxID=2874970 RepID=A0AAV1V2J7_9STRA
MTSVSCHAGHPEHCITEWQRRGFSYALLCTERRDLVPLTIQLAPLQRWRQPAPYCAQQRISSADTSGSLGKAATRLFYGALHRRNLSRCQEEPAPTNHSAVGPAGKQSLSRNRIQTSSRALLGG